ncbi:MAG: hypothetical protein FJ038_04300 [Chloroflexi bacterium]|nr:hypothetical protein [Chloroflexota bacterium]
MATIKHTEWLTAMLGNATHSFIDLNTDTIKLALLDQTDAGTITASTVDYDDVDTPTVLSTVTCAVTVSGATASSVGATFTSVTGDVADYLTAYKDSGSPATSPLIITWDSATTGLPVTPNGGNIAVTFTGNTFATLA